MCTSLTRYLFFTDNARDAVLLHVSASSEGQEYRKGTDAITRTAEQHTLTYSHACDSNFS